MKSQKKINKSKLDYKLSSEGEVIVHIEDIRDFVIEELRLTQDHTKICRAFEGMTSHLVVNSMEEDESMKVVRR